MRLLIISCSARKTIDDGLIPASERYDGTFYRVIRKAIREGHAENLDIAILSAKFGLIEWNTEIPTYDQVITPERVLRIERHVRSNMRLWLSRGYSEIFVNLGKCYAPLVQNMPQLRHPKTTWATGRIGERASQMKAWLQSPES